MSALAPPAVFHRVLYTESWLGLEGRWNGGVRVDRTNRVIFFPSCFFPPQSQLENAAGSDM